MADINTDLLSPFFGVEAEFVFDPQDAQDCLRTGTACE